MKRFKSIIFLIALLLCIFFSWKEYNKLIRDPFYSDSGWDVRRFPLLKPYEMINNDHGILGWSVTLYVDPSEKEIYYYINIHDITKFAIENNIIMVYTQYPEQVDEDVGEKILSWFVIIPDQKIETGFDTEIDFLEYIQAYGMEDQPVWLEPNKVYEQFDQTGYLIWIPSCE